MKIIATATPLNSQIQKENNRYISMKRTFGKSLYLAGKQFYIRKDMLPTFIQNHCNPIKGPFRLMGQAVQFFHIIRYRP
jgi:hypothetical protein